jgi:tRNA 5-methylaminomethyl-2-thiouridine biosynthesis bifunctional protein
MTLLALIGADAQSVTTALAWLSNSLATTDSTRVPDASAMLLVTPDRHSQLLAALPAALHITQPTNWPSELDLGFHPLRLGHVNLVVCVGQIETMLPDCVCQAQKVWVGHLSAEAAPVAAPAVTSLAPLIARLCAVQAELAWELPPTPEDMAAWLAAGFKPSHAGSEQTEPTDVPGQPSPHAPIGTRMRYEPRWPVPRWHTAAPSQAMVIGAGLAGAAVALCLVRAGWHVCLLDQHAGPAQAASGLPVGMLSAHVTARETLMSALSRVGMPLHMRELVAHVPEGQGWQRTHVTNLKGVDADADDSDHPLATPLPAPLTIPAALIRPAALVQAWLNEAQATGRLTTVWSAPVASLAQDSSSAESPLWRALDGTGHTLAQAPHVVVAAAYGSAALLAPHTTDMTPATPLRAVKGQMTLAPLHGEPLAPHALRQQGVFVPAYDDAAHPLAPRIWAMGSTYERGQNNSNTTAAAHARNADSLAAMHPEAHARLLAQAAQGETIEWAQVRCASLDRLPLVGALPVPGTLTPSTSLANVPRVAGLWTVSALGSRGLTLAMLAAQLLVARMQGGPLPVTKRHAAALDPARFALKHARKQAGKSTAAVSH